MPCGYRTAAHMLTPCLARAPLLFAELVLLVRRIGPEKGVIHIALGAVDNALWDMYARSRNKPLWKLIVDMTPVSCIRPFRRAGTMALRGDAQVVGAAGWSGCMRGLCCVRTRPPSIPVNRMELAPTAGQRSVDRASMVPRGGTSLPRPCACFVISPDIGLTQCFTGRASVGDSVQVHH